jgi:hypothetical protein
MILLLALSPVADAATPVIHDDTLDAEAVAAVAANTGLPSTQLASTRLDTLLAAPPDVLGDAVMRRCTQSTSTGSEVSAEVARAEAAWARSDRIGTMDHLDLAVAHAGCLSELVERGPAARAFRLRAEVALAHGEAEAARGELRTALAFEPQLAWADGRVPEGGAELLQDLRSGETSEVRLLPTSSATGPWIDGRTAAGALTLSEGLHLLQYSSSVGIRSAWVVVGGPATLVVPTGYRRPVIERVEDDARRSELEALIAAAVPEFYAAYVVHEGGVWLVADDGAGNVTTTPIAAPAEPEPVPEDEGKGRKRRKKKERKAR